MCWNVLSRNRAGSLWLRLLHHWKQEVVQIFLFPVSCSQVAGGGLRPQWTFAVVFWFNTSLSNLDLLSRHTSILVGTADDQVWVYSLRHGDIWILQFYSVIPGWICIYRMPKNQNNGMSGLQFPKHAFLLHVHAYVEFKPLMPTDKSQ